MTRSYALIMEDPDVPDGPPFVHWMMYNLPAGVTMLGEACPARRALRSRQARSREPTTAVRWATSGPGHHKAIRRTPITSRSSHSTRCSTSRTALAELTCSRPSKDTFWPAGEVVGTLPTLTRQTTFLVGAEGNAE